MKSIRFLKKTLANHALPFVMSREFIERSNHEWKRMVQRVLTPLFITMCLLYHCPAPADDTDISTEVIVQTDTIKQTTLHRYVQAYGSVEPETATHNTPAATSKLAAPVAGILAKVSCQEGQKVHKGDVLFTLDNRAADDQIAKVKVVLAFAQKNFARKQQLNPGETISQKLYDDAQQLLETAQTDLETAKTQRALLDVTAPLSGTLSAVHFKVGEAVSQSSVLADLIDLHRLDSVLSVPSREAEDLRLGQAVTLSTSDAGDTQAGMVSFISPQIDPMTDTVQVRVAFTNTDCIKSHCLRTGQFIHARIVVEVLQNRLAAPVESVVRTGDTATLAIVEGDHAKQVEVTTGLRDGNVIEVSGDGVHEGQTIVTQGAYGLPAATRIRVLK